MTKLNSELQQSVTALVQNLVRSPSQAGIDSIDAVAAKVVEWCDENGTPFNLLRADGELQGLLIRIPGDSAGKTLLLNACLDTADFGDVARWEHPPTSGVVVGDWLFGRGSADSKAGVAIFLHLAARFWAARDFAGELIFYFDGDEHTGRMQGIKTFLAEAKPPEFAMIGYPGREKVIVGARGFLRLRCTVFGMSAHTGSKSVTCQNAVVKAGRLVAELSREDLLPANTFSINPKLTVTAIEGGGGFALVPDKCVVSVDVRLTEEFQADAARDVIARVVKQIDARLPTGKETELLELNSLPAYTLRDDDLLSKTLLSAARAEFGNTVTTDVCGPSNIGNLLALHGVPATCGFGVRYKNVHAPNECAFLPDIAPVFNAYERAIEQILV